MIRMFMRDSGQISILVLAAVIALLSGTYLIGTISDLLIAKQRLNAKAESVALAGAMELEFNRDQACTIAIDFSRSNYELAAECISDSTSIQIELIEKSPTSILNSVFPHIYASSRAGIASDQ
jgi:hypothetical protein